MKSSVVFTPLMDEHGNIEQEGQIQRHGRGKGAIAKGPDRLNEPKSADDLMQVEERNTGAVDWTVYSKYLRFAGSLWWAPVIILLLVLSEGAQGDLACVYYLNRMLTYRCSWNQSIPRVLD
jgi:ATP-binding cassette subfamily C (CFTR/MRP) protein 1